MAKITIKKKDSSAVKKPSKPRAQLKPKETNFQKVAKKPKKSTPEEEAKERQRIKDNAKSAQKMDAFVQRPPPRYMTKEESARKKELFEDKAAILKDIEDAEARLEILLDPVRVLKNEIGGYKSTLNYHGKELKKFFGMKEPGDREEDEEMEKAKREIDSLFEEDEEEKPVKKREAGL